MKGPTYVERDSGIEKYRLRCLQIHHQRLNAIQNAKREEYSIAQGFKISKKEREIEERCLQNKLRANEFRETEYCTKLDRENDKLMRKLLNLTTNNPLAKSKCSRIRKMKTKPQNKRKARLKQMNSPKNSLNYSHRVSEYRKIVAENHSMAQRILQKKPHFKLKKFEDDYKKHLRYKNQIQKVKKGKGCFLPSLRNLKSNRSIMNIQRNSRQRNSTRGILRTFNTRNQDELNYSTHCHTFVPASRNLTAERCGIGYNILDESDI
ncbi:unnamed protein product [Moneuplotes crassus]|uniref:Uncharacterized protein n=1 Tax=Euplotes crassus TaxID=5936 RepID=A0AAD1XLY2_EUPCR|nr:unnamed protein product [Moneuplotes crassus]